MEVEGLVETPHEVINSYQPQYVMEAISTNTPVTMLLDKKAKFKAVVQGITIPVSKVTLNPHLEEDLSKKENHQKRHRKSSVVKFSKKAMLLKLKEGENRLSKEQAFVGISKRNRF